MTGFQAESFDGFSNEIIIFEDTYSPIPFNAVFVPEDSDRIAAFESMNLRKMELLATINRISEEKRKKKEIVSEERNRIAVASESMQQRRTELLATIKRITAEKVKKNQREEMQREAQQWN